MVPVTCPPVSRLSHELTRDTPLDTPRDTLTHEPRLEVANEVTPEPALLATAALRFSFWNLKMMIISEVISCLGHPLPDGSLLGVREGGRLLGLKPGDHLEAEDVPHGRVSVLGVPDVSIIPILLTLI